MCFTRPLDGGINNRTPRHSSSATEDPGQVLFTFCLSWLFFVKQHMLIHVCVKWQKAEAVWKGCWRFNKKKMPEENLWIILELQVMVKGLGLGFFFFLIKQMNCGNRQSTANHRFLTKGSTGSLWLLRNKVFQRSANCRIEANNSNKQ